MIDLTSLVPRTNLEPERHPDCDYCNRGFRDKDCTCAVLCTKLQCGHRYATWNGQWCPVAYISTPDGFIKPPVPTMKGATP